ncbi:MAG TPA: amidase family protein, partial [Gemmatimonadaceae bacterium]|nr:amidase family protein [Gemmatimonadaceae bacterium]
MTASSSDDGVSSKLSRRAFVGVGIAGALAAATGASASPVIDGVLARHQTPPSFELDEATIAQLQGWMTSGRYTSRALCEMYINRISEIDRTGPTLRSVLQLNPDALEIAAALDAERKSGHVRGPMHGIPVLIKDNIGTHDRMTTAAGSLALAHSIPLRDSFV